MTYLITLVFVEQPWLLQVCYLLTLVEVNLYQIDSSRATYFLQTSVIALKRHMTVISENFHLSGQGVV